MNADLSLMELAALLLATEGNDPALPPPLQAARASARGKLLALVPGGWHWTGGPVS